MLGQHVGRPRRYAQGIEVASAHGAAQGDALGQLVAGQREQAALGRAADSMARAAHPLQQHPDGAGRPNLANEVDHANVDTQLQRRRGHADFHLPGFQLLLGGQPGRAGEAAVVGDHQLLTQAFRKLMRDPLYQPPRVHEHQGRAVLHRQPGHGVQRLPPNLVAGDGAQFLLRKLQGQVDFPRMAGVHDGAVGHAAGADAVAAHQETPDLLDGALRGREPDSHHRLLGEGAQPFHRQRQVGAAFVVGNGVNFVENEGMHPAEALAPAPGSEQDVERLRRGDEDVGRALGHALPLGSGGVASAHGGADFGQGRALARRQRGYLLQGGCQVLLDVVGEGLQRGDVHHLHSFGKPVLEPLTHQRVNAAQERRPESCRSRWARR